MVSCSTTISQAPSFFPFLFYIPNSPFRSMFPSPTILDLNCIYGGIFVLVHSTYFTLHGDLQIFFHMVSFCSSICGESTMYSFLAGDLSPQIGVKASI